MQSKSVKPLATFRIYPDGRHLYVVVNIWPNKRSMQDHVGIGRGYMAVCTPLERINCCSGKPRKLGQFCEINFFRSALGIGVVSHEMGHAAFSWAARRRISMSRVLDQNIAAQRTVWEREGVKNTRQPANNPEERVVYVLGELCRQFTQKCYDLGLYKDVVVTTK